MRLGECVGGSYYYYCPGVYYLAIVIPRSFLLTEPRLSSVVLRKQSCSFPCPSLSLPPHKHSPQLLLYTVHRTPYTVSCTHPIWHPYPSPVTSVVPASKSSATMIRKPNGLMEAAVRDTCRARHPFRPLNDTSISQHVRRCPGLITRGTCPYQQPPGSKAELTILA